jgi:L-2-hydroxyglutarate oxidase LhgO
MSTFFLDRTLLAGATSRVGAIPREMIAAYATLEKAVANADHAGARLGDKSGEHWDVQSKFVFIGAGGRSLPLLQKSKIHAGRSYAGFPVSGIWLRCDDPDVSSRHDAKVYGKASVGAPLMSEPHPDTRHIEGGVAAFRAL